MLRPDRFMKKAGITELKKNFSQYLEWIKCGESILVFNRNQPVARIIPLKKASRSVTPDAARLARLERKCLIRRGNGDSSLWVAKRRLVKVEGSMLQDLLAERRTGR